MAKNNKQDPNAMVQVAFFIPYILKRKVMDLAHEQDVSQVVVFEAALRKFMRLKQSRKAELIQSLMEGEQ